MSFLLVGKKIGMTQVYDDQNRLVPVSAIQVSPAYVSQVKTSVTDGYQAVQFAAFANKEHRVAEPVLGHLKKAGLGPFSLLKEFRTEKSLDNYQLGDLIDVTKLKLGQLVDVTGISIGKGFEGVVRRHGFKIQPKSHGSMAHRRPGSIGQRQWPGEVIKNKKMPGRMGYRGCTVQNLLVVGIVEEKHIVLIKGGVPGNSNGLLYIRPAKKAPLKL